MTPSLDSVPVNQTITVPSVRAACSGSTGSQTVAYVCVQWREPTPRVVIWTVPAVVLNLMASVIVR